MGWYYLWDLPKCSASMEIVVKSTGQVIRYNLEDEVPRSVMDAYQQVVGNGLAKVTVSADMSIKDFGTGASAMCAVTLSCNQDQQTIERAAQLAGELARGFAQENRARAERELQAIVDARKAELAGTSDRPRYG